MSDDKLRKTYQDMIARRAGQDRSQCPPAERLHELVSRSGSEDTRLALANHVMACPHCLPEFELLRSMEAAMPEKKPALRWMALAASIAVLVTAGIIGRQLLRPTSDVLRENPVVRLIAPADGDQVSAPVRLIWNRVPDAVEYQVQILTSEGSLVYRGTTPDTAMAVDSLAGSQFIWQVSAEYSTGEPARSRPTRFSLRTP
jgi:hypothetical protein